MDRFHMRLTPLTDRIYLVLTVLILIVLSSRGLVAQDEIPASYSLIAENEHFELYVDETTLAFKLLDVRNGYLWHSGLDEPAETDRLNSSWQAFARSGISIEYLDERAVSRRVSLANSPHTLQVTAIEQGISAQIFFEDYSIALEVILQLEDDGIRVSIPASSIREEDPIVRFGRVFLYPFLGATRGSEIPGYMLLPDGMGSIVRFADTTKADNMFYGRYYGPDLGILGTQAFDTFVANPDPISAPVYGIVHEDTQNAMLTVIESGAAYGELQAHPSGITTNFNFLYNTFVYSERYFQATNRSGDGVTIVQRERNTFDVVMHYRFLTGDDANYVGLARSYQQYLVDAGQLQRQEFTHPDIGIFLEFLGGDNEDVLFWSRFISMTTIQQMSDILADLQLPHAEVVYYGWQPYGAYSMPSTSLTLEGGLGSVDELRALVERISADGGHFSLYVDPQSALFDVSGYSPRNDLAMAITNINIEGFQRLYTYYLTFPAIQERYQALLADVDAQSDDVGLAIDSLGSTLFSDFRQGNRLNREDAIGAYQSLFDESPVRLGFYRPNDYLWRDAQAYYYMPASDNGYIFTAESVPFLPIVLAGYLPYYSTPLNFSADIEDDLLRLIEFGSYPSYFLTHEPTASMLNTASSWIYTSSYAQWGTTVQETYQWMNALLAPVRGEAIVAHERLARGVAATTYANGLQIIVNYNDYPFVREGITVEPNNALLLEDPL